MDTSQKNLISATILEHVILSSNHLTGVIPRELGNMSNLVTLDLGKNQLRGTVGTALGTLTELHQLNLSSNQFNGSIPVFKNCDSLYYLDLSHNLLTGNIPIELAYCRSLAQVRLSYNNLSGVIPIEFQSLRFTNYDLSHNNLSGNIPNINSQVQSSLSISPSDVSDGGLKYHPNQDASDDGSNNHSNEPGLPMLYIVLLLDFCLLNLILVPAIAYIYCCATKKSVVTEDVKNGDLFSVWNYDGNFAFEDIIRATKNFDIKYCIGTGGYGTQETVAYIKPSCQPVKLWHSRNCIALKPRSRPLTKVLGMRFK